MIYDVAIFGGGIVGTGILNLLCRAGHNAVLLEKCADVSTGATKANSGLVHAGFDCVSNTKKAKFNLLGAKEYPLMCKRLGVEFEQIGAVVVAENKQDLKPLLQRGLQNGVKNISIILSKQLHELVPNLKPNFNYGLYAKSAGIVSPYGLCVALCEEAIVCGGTVLLNYNCTNIVKKELNKNNFYFEITNGKKIVKAKQIVNSTASGFNQLSSLYGGEKYNLQFKRGQYFVLDKCDFVGVTVFPLPTNAGKGILATPTVSGNILFGPTSENFENSKATTADGLNQIRQSISSMFNNVPWDKVIRKYSGVRVSVGDDFIVEKSKINGVVNIAGINSPGISAMPQIAVEVCDLLNLSTKIKKFEKRVPYTNFAKLSQKKQNELIKLNPNFGKIVCRCEIVSEAEIMQAIHSHLPAITVDGIKRRVRAGMGRCQGGFCTTRICEIISRETGMPIQNILKEYKNSEIMPYSTLKTKESEE
ncbi:MAG: FAD-dependent oxidoreductase [Clostridia bacterium]